MKVLLICRVAPGVDAASQFGPHLAAERDGLVQLKSSGVLLEAYTPGGPGAVLIVDVTDRGHAEQIAAALPLRQAQLIEVELINLTTLDLPAPGPASAEH